MKIIDCIQGDEIWATSRLGIVTASCMDMIITPTGEKSSQAGKLMNRLLAEMITARNCESFKGNVHTDRGKEYEDEAVRYYSLECEEAITKVGFCITDDSSLGCSPDRFVGAAKGLEIKTANPDIMIDYYLSEKLEQHHRPQVQASLYVTGRKSWDTMLYTPDMKPIITTSERNESYITTMCGLLERFNAALAEKKQLLHAKGIL